MYYAIIIDNELYTVSEATFKGENVQNIEITEDVFNNIDHYIWNGEEIVLNPNYEQEQLEKAKNEKYQEALEKAFDYQENGSVEHKNCIFEMSESNRNNLRDTVEALTLIGETSTTWNDKDDNFVELTIEDIQYIRLNLILGEIQKLWIAKYPYYKSLIEAAETVEQVEAIVIDYSVEVNNNEESKE